MSDLVIATDDCRVDGVLAAKAGDKVPAELATRYDWPVRDLDSDEAASQEAIEGKEPTRPAGNASRDEWAAYALTRGAVDAEVEPLSRDELREKYGA